MTIWDEQRRREYREAINTPPMKPDDATAYRDGCAMLLVWLLAAILFLGFAAFSGWLGRLLLQ